MALSSPSPEIEQLPTSPGCLCQGRFIASMDDIGASWNTGGTALLREARRAGLRFSTGRSSSGGHRRAPTATSRLGLALRRSGASRQGKMCWIASVCFCTAENCWTQSSTVSPNSPAWETRASRKLTLSTSLLSARLSHRRRSWTTSVDIAFPRDCAVTSSRRAQFLLQPRVGTTLVHLNALAWCTHRIAMACSAQAAWPAAL